MSGASTLYDMPVSNNGAVRCLIKILASSEKFHNCRMFSKKKKKELPEKLSSYFLHSEQ
jgi:hypothetical protein